MLADVTDKFLRTQDFTLEGVHVEAWVRESPSRVPQKLKQNMKFVYNFNVFLQQKRFNEYKSRDWTVYFANTHFKKILKTQWGFAPPPNSTLNTPVQVKTQLEV